MWIRVGSKPASIQPYCGMFVSGVMETENQQPFVVMCWSEP